MNQTLHQLGLWSHIRVFDLFSFLVGVLAGALLVTLILRGVRWRH